MSEAPVTDAERDFMLRPTKHSGESMADKVVRDRGVGKRVTGRTPQGTLVTERVIDPKFAMDAVVPNRGDEETQKAFDALSPVDREQEIRNAQAQANIRNTSRTLR